MRERSGRDGGGEQRAMSFGGIADYGLAVTGVLLAGVAAAVIRPYVHSAPAMCFFVVVALMARRGTWGPTLVAVAFSTLTLDYFFLPPLHAVDIGQDLVNGGALLMVAFLLERLRSEVRSAEREVARLEGVRLTAGELCDRLSSTLMLSAGAIEQAEALPSVPDDLRRLLGRAHDRLLAAGEDLTKLQMVSRVETHSTPHGLALDLDRSIGSPVPASSLPDD